MNLHRSKCITKYLPNPTTDKRQPWFDLPFENTVDFNPVDFYLTKKPVD